MTDLDNDTSESDKPLDVSLTVLKTKLEYAKLKSIDVPAEKTQQVIDAFEIVEQFLQRSDVRNILKSTNAKSEVEAILHELAEGYDPENDAKKRLKKQIVFILAAAVAAALGSNLISSFFGF